MAVLGGLGVMPMTGYALRQAIRDVLGHFWSESFGQIYPTLARLERGGLVARASGEPAAPYVITASGVDRLRELLAQPIQQAPPRNGLLLRLFFGRQLGPQACRQLLLDARQEAEAKLEQFAMIRHEIASEPENDVDPPYWLLTVSAGEHATRATIAWADESLAALDVIGATS